MSKKLSNIQYEIRIKELEDQVASKVFSEKLAQTLFEISNAVNTTVDLNDLYRSIYDSLNHLLTLPNFYIAIYDEKKRTIHFPFYVDEHDEQFHGNHYYAERIFVEDNSLTSEVIVKQRPVYLNEKQLKKRESEGKIIGITPKIWIGVPLMVQDNIIGAVAVQSYSDPDYFSKKDIDILVSVSNHVALAIERKQAIDELKILRNYLHNIINSMPSILIGVNKNGTVTQWNYQAELETGIKASDAKDKNLADVFPRFSGYMSRIQESIRLNRIKTLLKQPYSNGKETRYEDIIIYPLITNGVDDVVIRLDDITAQVRLEEMVAQSDKMLSIGGVAAGMAHEINNPLAGMMQNAQVVYKRLSLDIPANENAALELGLSMKDIRAYMEKRDIYHTLDRINEAGGRAATIIKNMLGFARKSAPALEPHDLSLVLKETLELARTDNNLKKQIDFKDITIIEDYDTAIAHVAFDKSKIQQVLLNILKNGAEAMAEIKKESYTPQFILRSYRKNNFACIAIEDNGPGISDETRKRIFEPFFTTKSKHGGTGLGLSISYFIIVNDHKGKMDVESIPGKSTTFIIELPY